MTRGTLLRRGARRDARAILKVTGLALPAFTRAGLEARGIVSAEGEDAEDVVDSRELVDGSIVVDLLSSFDTLRVDPAVSVVRAVHRVVGDAMFFHEDPRGIFVFQVRETWVLPSTYDDLVHAARGDGFWLPVPTRPFWPLAPASSTDHRAARIRRTTKCDRLRGIGPGPLVQVPSSRCSGDARLVSAGRPPGEGTRMQEGKGNGMQVVQGHSRKTDGMQAVAEATEGWSPKGGKFDLIIVFTSTAQNPHDVARALGERFPDTPTVGCTTAGEHLGKEHYNGGLVVMGLVTPRIRWATTVVENVATFDEEVARVKSDALFSSLKLVREDVDPQKQFCLVFVDGLSCKEEVVSSLMADALEGLPLLGGSAGDDLRSSVKRTSTTTARPGRVPRCSR